jgi:hypothetical protein
MKKILLIGALVASTVVGSWATTWDNTVGGTNGYPAFLGRKVYTISREINLATYTNTITTSDVVKMINVPATSVVLAVTYCIPTVCTNSTTLDIGDNGSATRFVSNLDVTAAGSQVETLSATPLMKNNVADIRLTADGALGHTGIIRVKACILDLNQY